MSLKPTKAKARRRAEVIIQVQSGLITPTALPSLTPTEAAEKLGVSRKVYYKWEKRALEAMLSAVSDRQPGRPRKVVDPEKEAFEKSISEMEKQLVLAEQRSEIRDYFFSSREVEEMQRIQKELTKKKRGTRNDRISDGDTED